MKCTNPYLPEGYRITDQTGADIAVLDETGHFILWRAGDWRPKSLRKMTRGLKTFNAARKASSLRIGK